MSKINIFSFKLAQTEARFFGVLDINMGLFAIAMII